MRTLVSIVMAILAINLSWSQTTSTPAAEVLPHPDRGIYSVWIQPGREKDMDLPFIKGGQICLQWADLEPEEGKYDFSALDKQAQVFRDRRMKCTVQVNANRKPGWMFKCIPYYTKGMGAEEDPNGRPMYWYPRFTNAYLNFLKAFADHLKRAPYKDTILGVRQNFNAIGTEGIVMNDPQAKDLKNWVIPEGISTDTLHAWTAKDQSDYQRVVMQAWVKEFVPDIFVFVRGHLPDPVLEPYLDLFESGKLGLFSTGATPVETKNDYFIHMYTHFAKYSKTGKALGYAEPMSDCWGYHGRPRQNKPKMIVTPAQMNYWRLLLDLHYGLSFIACYGMDLDMACDGTHPYEGKLPELKDEFYQADLFATKYAGYLNSPSQSPGAWVALRQLDRKPGDEKYPLTNDCEFLMKRLPDNSKGIKNAGPPNQRFGGWARVLAKGETMNLVMDKRFKKSLAGKPGVIHLIYLDNENGTIQLAAGGQTYPIEMKNSGKWVTASVDLAQAQFANDDEADIHVTCPEAELTLHMLELSRLADAESWSQP